MHTLLLALIPAACLAVVLFGLILCRLGARSDDDQAVALAEWIRAGRLTEREVFDPEASVAQLAQDLRSEEYRATG